MGYGLYRTDHPQASAVPLCCSKVPIPRKEAPTNSSRILWQSFDEMENGSDEVHCVFMVVY